jgi:anti-sigma factor RsiW
MKACVRAREELLLCLDGELELERELALEQHLEGCPECAELRARALMLEHGLQQLVQAGSRAPDVERALARIRARLAVAPPPSQAEESSATSRPGFRRWPVRALAGLAAAALLFAGLHRVFVQDWRPVEPSTPALAGAVPPPPVEPVQPSAESARPRDAARAAFARAAESFDGLQASAAQARATWATLERELAQEHAASWPLSRWAEEFLGASDLRQACAAARWLGACAASRSDRAAARALEAALAREVKLAREHATSAGELQLRTALVLALEDAGAQGSTGLALALGFEGRPGNEGLVERARSALLRAESSAARSALAPALESGHAPGAVGLELMAELDREGRAWLMQFALRERGSRSAALAALGGHAEAGSTLLEWAERARTPGEEELVVAACAALRAPPAEPQASELCAWLERSAQRRTSRLDGRERVPAALAAVGGVRAVAALVALEGGTLSSSEDVRAAFARLLERGGAAQGAGGRASAVEDWIDQATAAGDEAGLQAALALLASSGTSRAVPPLLDLAGALPLDVHARGLALLAVGELGTPEQAQLLNERWGSVLARGSSSERRLLLAAGLHALFALAGEPALEPLVPEAQPRAKLAAALLALRQRTSSVSLFKLARSLDADLLARLCARALRETRTGA